MINSEKIKKSFRGLTFKQICLISSAVFAILFLTLFILMNISDNSAINSLKTQITKYETEIESLNNQVITSKERVEHFKNELTKIITTNDKIKDTIASLNRRLEEVQQFQLDQYLKQSQATEDSPSKDDIANLQTQITTLQFQISSVNQKIYELNKQNITSVVNNQTTNTGNATTTTAKTVVRPLKPNFAIVGIESRGGQLFVAVAPSSSAKLNQISLLREGDSYRGWQLKTIRTNAAVFNVGGRQQVISIR
ncbi:MULTISPECIES: hypothetical protein [Entomomonas]|uniref:Uncharacterized protein n=1 Tax=Entomomonas asaccharolytica TaxID=2785331 RepID=A0A974NHB6_9GAMM|nr:MULTISPECIES: hypothetical protein [Entomomonas]QQP86835.1 hypothetical protein JHT90_06230 [Entomomonas asaccharolytica]UYZ83547.1 hypothetical protein MTZ49_13225 [Entomomonas sp. E2T0]